MARRGGILVVDCLAGTGEFDPPFSSSLARAFPASADGRRESILNPGFKKHSA